jgi:hypothetical protein
MRLGKWNTYFKVSKFGDSQTLFISFLVIVWFYANGQYGFNLKSSAKLFREPENFLYLLWVMFLVSWTLPLGTAVVLSVSRIFAEERGKEEDVEGPIENRDTNFVLWPWPDIISERGPPPLRNGIYIILLASHWVGISFTALAFVVGSISTVQVLKSFAPLFTAVSTMCYLNATLPRKAIVAVSDEMLPFFPVLFLRSLFIPNSPFLFLLFLRYYLLDLEFPCQ